MFAKAFTLKNNKTNDVNHNKKLGLLYDYLNENYKFNTYKLSGKINNVLVLIKNVKEPINETYIIDENILYDRKTFAFFGDRVVVIYFNKGKEIGIVTIKGELNAESNRNRDIWNRVKWLWF